MRYGSVCSGIEAATAAWEPLGWEAAFYAEIEKFPRAVLAHHYPDVPLHGDFTTIKGNEYGPIDILVGGTPCQDFSVAGKRAGLDAPRGNLAMEFLALARRIRPRWLLFENVPGLPSSWTADGAPGEPDPPDDLEEGEEREVVESYEYDETSDFWTFNDALRECGYGVAYRILDAQYFGVPQRRRRVFLVGYLGDWRPAAAVLFERESLSRNPPPLRKTGAGVAALSQTGVGASGPDDNQAQAGHLMTETSVTISAKYGEQSGQEMKNEGALMAYGGNNTAGAIDTATAVNAHGGPHGRLDFESETFVAQTIRARDGAKGVDSDCTDTLVAHTLRAEGHDASEDGTGRGVPLTVHARQDPITGSDVALPIEGAGVSTQAVALTDGSRGTSPDQAAGGMIQPVGLSSVRRLTPRECERLQGFPDDYTLIPWGGKPAEQCPDGPRYKALGNSMAVPVMRWLGERIELVEAILAEQKLEATA